MNKLLNNGQIFELNCGSNFAYIVNDHASFLPTEYKVLQSQGKSVFISCMKMLYNGKIQLYYLTEGYAPLSSLIYKISAENLMVVVTDYLSDVIEARNNGFLFCGNIELTFDKIFVDPSTYTVKLIYVPLGTRMHNDVAAFEDDLRSGFVQVLSKIPAYSSVKIKQLVSYFQDATLSLEGLLSKIKSGNMAQEASEKEESENEEDAETPERQIPPVHTAAEVTMKIIALNVPLHLEFEINKNEYVLGKRAGYVDGLIPFNNMISRIHCKILRRGNQFAVVDMMSQNGTYVNQFRLQPNCLYSIKNGDILRLANSDFRVVIG